MSNGLPLTGITVVEIGTSVAAPYGSWILGCLGARVIKIESDRGDDARQWGRMLPDGRSSFFEALNANKESVVLDLRDEGDRTWLKTFCETEADVVVQNMRPGKITELGLDGPNLALANPRLIYFNLGAFGAVGPKSSAPGYDPLMQAAAGIMSVTGEPDRPPVRVGVSIVDMGSGMWAAIGVLAALFQRKDTGRGSIIDGSLYETAVAWVTNQAAMVQVDGRNPEKVGSGARGMAPYQAYECADGYIVVSAPNDNLFSRLCPVLGLGTLLDDPRFATNQRRYANLEALNGYINPVLKRESRDHWTAVLEAAGVPCAPVRQITEMLDDEQTRALGIVQSLPGTTPALVGLPISFDGERPPLRTMPPALGADTSTIRGTDAMRMEYETLLLERVDEHILVVTFNRPEVRNARNTQMGLDQMEVMRSLYIDAEGIRVVILTGSGDKAFSAGGDLKERKAMSEDDWKRQHAIFEQNVMALRDCPVPVIAAVNGACFAGGLENALNCDFVYAADHALFALTEVKLGIIPGCTGTQMLPAAVGERRAKEIILTGEPFSAQQALEWGLVNKVVPYESLMGETMATARKITANAPLSVLRAKRAISAASQMDRHTGFQFELEAYNRLIGTEDRVEAVNAFNEKRSPNYKGK